MFMYVHTSYSDSLPMDSTVALYILRSLQRTLHAENTFRLDIGGSTMFLAEMTLKALSSLNLTKTWEGADVSSMARCRACLHVRGILLTIAIFTARAELEVVSSEFDIGDGSDGAELEVDLIESLST